MLAKILDFIGPLFLGLTVLSFGVLVLVLLCLLAVMLVSPMSMTIPPILGVIAFKALVSLCISLVVMTLAGLLYPDSN